jgi:hypothetical protein
MKIKALRETKNENNQVSYTIQSKWKKEKEMEAFLAYSLYSEVLNSEGNEFRR